MRHLLAILTVTALSAHAATPQLFEATCGATKFRVAAVNTATHSTTRFPCPLLPHQEHVNSSRANKMAGSMQLASPRRKESLSSYFKATVAVALALKESTGPSSRLP